SQPIARSEIPPHPFRKLQITAVHAQRMENVLTEVAVQPPAADVLYDLTEGGEPVVTVRADRTRFSRQPEFAAVVLRQRGQPFTLSVALPEPATVDHAQGMDPLRYPRSVGQQVPHRRGPPARICGYQLVATQVFIRRAIQVHQPPFPELHDRDGRKGLGDRGDPKKRVLADRRSG